jgi:hypothetical protein
VAGYVVSLVERACAVSKQCCCFFESEQRRRLIGRHVYVLSEVGVVTGRVIGGRGGGAAFGSCQNRSSAGRGDDGSGFRQWPERCCGQEKGGAITPASMGRPTVAQLRRQLLPDVDVSDGHLRAPLSSDRNRVEGATRTPGFDFSGGCPEKCGKPASMALGMVLLLRPQ